MCAGIWFIFTLLNIYTLNLYYSSTSPKIRKRYSFDFPNQLFPSNFRGWTYVIAQYNLHDKAKTHQEAGTRPLMLPPLFSDAQSERDNGSFTHSAIIFRWLDSVAQLLPQGTSCVLWVINNTSFPLFLSLIPSVDFVAV